MDRAPGMAVWGKEMVKTSMMVLRTSAWTAGGLIGSLHPPEASRIALVYPIAVPRSWRIPAKKSIDLVLCVLCREIRMV